MRLYYKPGACSLASHIVLEEIGLPFDLVKANTETGTTESGEDFSRVSPNGYVPALKIQSGEIITENPAVLQYLADQSSVTGLAPANGTLQRIRLQELLNFLSSELHKAFGPFFSGRDLSADARLEAERNVGRRVRYIEQRLSNDNSFLLGEDFTVADAYAFVVLNWANVVGIDLSSWPRTQAYMERIRIRPAVVRAMTTEGLLPKEAAA
ncbi:MAG: glutathione binding-like protein [Pseudomonadota bacterium]